MLHCRGQKRKGKEKVCAPAVQSLQVNRKGLEDSHGDTAEKLPDYRRRL